MRIRTKLGVISAGTVALTIGLVWVVHHARAVTERSIEIDGAAAEIVHAVGRLAGLLQHAGPLRLARVGEQWQIQAAYLESLLAEPGATVSAEHELVRLRELLAEADRVAKPLFAPSRVLGSSLHQVLVGQLAVKLDLMTESAFELGERSRALVLDTQRRSAVTLEALLLIYLSVVLTGAAALLRGILRPLGLLGDGAQRVVDGSLDHRIGIREESEIGEVAVAFDAMLDQLAQRRRELHRTERDLVRQRATMQSVLESLDEGVSYYDESDRLAFWNSTFAEIQAPIREHLRAGLPFGEVVQRVASQRTEWGNAPDAEGWVRSRMERHRSGTDEPIEVRLEHDRWLRINETKTAEGGTVETFVDISALKHRERDLARTNAALERSNSELQQFAYVASHDLQEPLRMVASFTELLRKRYEGRLDEAADRYIGFAVGGAQRMQSLLTDLLEYSRLDRAERPLGACSARHACAEALANLAAAVGESGARVDVGALPEVHGDPHQLMQLFQNLLGNAIKFRAAAVPPVVHVAARDDGALWRFTVADNGIGIQAEDPAGVFEVFKRLQHRDAYAGTGIGLAICRKVVERHGGRIWFEPSEGGGTTFHFTLHKAVSETGATDEPMPRMTANG